MLTTIVSSGLTSENITKALEPDKANNAQLSAQTIVKSITQEIVELEVQQALLNATFTSDSPVMQAINSKLQSLHKKLAQLQPGNKTTINIAVRQAIKAKIEQLELERALLNVTYTPNSVVIQDKQRKINSLKKRFLQIQPNNQTALTVTVAASYRSEN